MSTEKIFADERKQLIVELLNIETKKSVADLCEHFNVSPATMRSDLRDLEAIGLLKRTHGGAMSNKKMIFEPTATEKQSDRNMEKKEEIARIAIQYVQDDDVIILDTGSTVYELVKLLPQKRNLTVITYDFKILSYLDAHSDANVIFLGGQLRRNFHCVIGPMAINAVKDLNADRVFLGANGLSIEKGVSTPNIDLATIKKEMIRISDERIVLCDSTKFERTSFAKFAEINEMDLIISDHHLDKQQMEVYKNAGVDLEVGTK